MTFASHPITGCRAFNLLWNGGEERKIRKHRVTAYTVWFRCFERRNEEKRERGRQVSAKGGVRTGRRKAGVVKTRPSRGDIEGRERKKERLANVILQARIVKQR